jgi:predicted amidohydrolase
MPTYPSVEANEETIAGLMSHCDRGDILVMPEGALSGYDDELHFLQTLEQERIDQALDRLAKVAQAVGACAWVGSIMRYREGWANCAIGLYPDGSRFMYRKANLSGSERRSGVFFAGNSLPVFEVPTLAGMAKVGVQLCREVRFPEHWRTLADKGAQLLLHLTNGRGSANWRPHLISRAAENERFLVSASNASSLQLSNSIIISPDGAVVGEIEQPGAGVLRSVLNLDMISDSLLSQRRSNIV